LVRSCGRGAVDELVRDNLDDQAGLVGLAGQLGRGRRTHERLTQDRAILVTQVRREGDLTTLRGQVLEMELTEPEVVILKVIVDVEGERLRLEVDAVLEDPNRRTDGAGGGVEQGRGNDCRGVERLILADELNRASEE